MGNDCYIENWFKKNKSWILFILGLIIIWVIGIVVIAWFSNSKLNKALIGILGGSINTSDAINLGVAIGTIALAVFAWMAYKYATEQYLQNQKEKLIFKKKTLALTNICNAIIMAEFTLKEQSESTIIWIEENPETNSMEISKMLDQEELQISSEEEESKVIRLLTPFLKKIDQAIYDLTELNILFSHSTNDIETMLDKLKTEFSQELCRASKPFGNGQIKTRDDLQNVIGKIYNRDIFKRWKKELNHIAKEF